MPLNDAPALCQHCVGVEHVGERCGFAASPALLEPLQCALHLLCWVIAWIQFLHPCKVKRGHLQDGVTHSLRHTASYSPQQLGKEPWGFSLCIAQVNYCLVLPRTLYSCMLL